jgi:hypothetical protein
MEKFKSLENLQLTVSNSFKIKQDERNSLKDEIEKIMISILTEQGLEVSKIGKELAFKLDNLQTRLPKGYVPVKIAISIPSVDFDIDLERKYYEQDIENKRLEKAEKERKKALKIERDKLEREAKKAEKERILASSKKED